MNVHNLKIQDTRYVIMSHVEHQSYRIKKQNDKLTLKWSLYLPTKGKVDVKMKNMPLLYMVSVMAK